MAPRFLVAGPRDWTDRAAVLDVLSRLAAVHPDATIVHGACSGADELAGSAARQLGLAVEAHPALWETCSCGRDCVTRRVHLTRHGQPYCPAAGPARNAHMVRLPHMSGVFICRRDGGLTPGSESVKKLARAAGLPVWPIDRSVLPPRPPGPSVAAIARDFYDIAQAHFTRSGQIGPIDPRRCGVIDVDDIPSPHPVPEAPRPSTPHKAPAPPGQPLHYCSHCQAHYWDASGDAPGKPCQCPRTEDPVDGSDVIERPWYGAGRLYQMEEDQAEPDQLWAWRAEPAAHTPMQAAAEVMADLADIEAARDADDGDTRKARAIGTEPEPEKPFGQHAPQPAITHQPSVYSRKSREPIPPGAIYVGRDRNGNVSRQAPWGNPFKAYGKEANIQLYRAMLEARLKGQPDYLEPLRGRDLVCWCHPEPCHADVLIELANR